MFKYVRWCGDIDIYENPSSSTYQVNFGMGREGHVTEKEARIRASKVMQEVISKVPVCSLGPCLVSNRIRHESESSQRLFSLNHGLLGLFQDASFFLDDEVDLANRTIEHD
ncbi:MAG: hypothetical protein R3B95_04610 [Nitrospirales bacterium]|nr:hypothetical protein [Nitrospirales bacterium]